MKKIVGRSTPETFLDKQIVMENKEEKDTMISLKGFSANEKVHMILQVQKKRTVFGKR